MKEIKRYFYWLINPVERGKEIYIILNIVALSIVVTIAIFLIIVINKTFLFSTEFSGIFKDIFTGIAAIIASVVALLGLSAWRKQMRGVKEFETAFNLHLSLLKMREAVKFVRNYVIWPAESEKAKSYSKEKYPYRSEEEIESSAHINVYEMRWEKISGAYTQIESHLLAAEVLWGKEIVNLLQPLKVKINELNIALSQYYTPQELRTMKPEEIRNIIFYTGDGLVEDKFGKEINQSIEGMVNYIQKKIS